jgi:2-polyprenyl-3-methyl-5-hydroxy-6-metoxy-1,4-benzoquinol methylase
MAADWSEYGMQRRVAGIHDLRLDGMTDILQRVRGRQTLDLGCNRGLVSYDF